MSINSNLPDGFEPAAPKPAAKPAPDLPEKKREKKPLKTGKKKEKQRKKQSREDWEDLIGKPRGYSIEAEEAEQKKGKRGKKRRTGPLKVLLLTILFLFLAAVLLEGVYLLLGDKIQYHHLPTITLTDETTEAKGNP